MKIRNVSAHELDEIRHAAIRENVRCHLWTDWYTGYGTLQLHFDNGKTRTYRALLV